MAMIKPKFNGKDATSSFYDGPPPTPGTYRGEVTRMGLAQVLSGENEGADKIVVVVRITHGKFKGAEIFANFTILLQSAWSFNTFLEAMTDGSEKQRTMIKDWFWEKGYDVEDEAKNEKLGRQVNWIGKPVFKPIGKTVSFTTTMDGERANISKFVVPLEGSGSEEPEDDSTVAELPDVATESTDDAVIDAEVVSDDSAVAVADDDDDDPWS